MRIQAKGQPISHDTPKGGGAAATYLLGFIVINAQSNPRTLALWIFFVRSLCQAAKPTYVTYYNNYARFGIVVSYLT